MDDFRKMLDESPEFSLQDMFRGEPGIHAQAVRAGINEYNKGMISDRKLHNPDQYYYPAVRGQENLQELFNALPNTNGADTFRYFNPNSRFVNHNLRGGLLGQVADKTPDLVELNSQYHYGEPLSKRLNTLLHESSHVDDNRRPDKKSNLFGDVPGLNYYELFRGVPESIKSKYLTAGNAEDHGYETRANLRAGLGIQKKGTSEEEYFKDLMDTRSTWTNPVTYTPTEAKGMFDQVQLRGKEAIMKGLMNDLFPRERYLEPREPTWKESIQDKIQSLKDIFK
jgi:hypothetical protein